MRTRLKLVAVAALAVVASGVLLLAWRFRESRAPRVAGGEFGAVAHLRSYLGAQGTFQRQDRYGKKEFVYANPRDGTGFPDLFRVGGPDGSGETLKYIDETFARATTPRMAKSGYWYVDIVADSVTGPYDFEHDCGLCAVPAVSGARGYYTYIVNITGTVYKKDNGGTPVTVFPDVVKEAWVPVGE